VFCTLLDRKQQRVALVLLDPAVFCVDDCMDSMDVTGGHNANGSHAHNIHVLIEDTSDIWLKVPPHPRQICVLIERIMLTSRYWFEICVEFKEVM
jgi:hypothetical protein